MSYKQFYVDKRVFVPGRKNPYVNQANFTHLNDIISQILLNTPPGQPANNIVTSNAITSLINANGDFDIQLGGKLDYSTSINGRGIHNLSLSDINNLTLQALSNLFLQTPDYLNRPTNSILQMIDSTTGAVEYTPYSLPNTVGSGNDILYVDDFGNLVYGPYLIKGVQNGLTLDPTTLVLELGGPLVKDTTIDGDSHSINFVDLSIFQVETQDLEVSVNETTFEASGETNYLPGIDGDFIFNDYNGVPKLFFDSETGNVGINTITPSCNFHLEDGTFCVNNAVSATQNYEHKTGDIGIVGRTTLAGNHQGYVNISNLDTVNFLGLLSNTVGTDKSEIYNLSLEEADILAIPANSQVIPMLVGIGLDSNVYYNHPVDGIQAIGEVSKTLDLSKDTFYLSSKKKDYPSPNDGISPSIKESSIDIIKNGHDEFRISHFKSQLLPGNVNVDGKFDIFSEFEVTGASSSNVIGSDSSVALVSDTLFDAVNNAPRFSGKNALVLKGEELHIQTDSVTPPKVGDVLVVDRVTDGTDPYDDLGSVKFKRSTGHLKIALSDDSALLSTSGMLRQTCVPPEFDGYEVESITYFISPATVFTNTWEGPTLDIEYMIFSSQPSLNGTGAAIATTNVAPAVADFVAGGNKYMSVKVTSPGFPTLNEGDVICIDSMMDTNATSDYEGLYAILELKNSL